MKVSQLVSNRSGKPVANQFAIIDDDGNMYFQSYDSIIAKVDRGNKKIYLDVRYWDYSVTTSKYRNQFLDETTKETKAKIESGDYILTNLNRG